MEIIPMEGFDEISVLIKRWNGKYYNIKEAAENYTVYNCDAESEDRSARGMVISCGMSPKATITASSVRDEGFVCCVQRSFCDSKGQIIEQKEFFVPTFGVDLSVSLSAAACNLIIGGIFGENGA